MLLLLLRLPAALLGKTLLPASDVLCWSEVVCWCSSVLLLEVLRIMLLWILLFALLMWILLFALFALGLVSTWILTCDGMAQELRLLTFAALGDARALSITSDGATTPEECPGWCCGFYI